MFLTGTAAAGAIALINATGNLGGYIGPFVVGWIKDSSRSFEAGLYFLAASAIACAVITFLAARASKPPEGAPAGAVQPAAE
jgi:ACS family tartrate transporter-like MFS transporter